MEQAGLSVEPGSVGQLEPDFQLDFDPEAEAEADADGFDIRLDGAYDEVEQGSGEPVVDQPTDLNTAPEIGYEDEEERAESAIHEQAHSEATEDSDKRTEAELEAEVEYQDEIGYDDEDAVATDSNADLGSTDPAEANPRGSNVSSDGQSESVRVGEDVSNEVPANGEDAILHQDVDSDEHYENTDPRGNLADDEEDKSADPTVSDHLTAQEFEEMDHEQYDVDHHEEPYPAPSDIDKAIQDLADSLAQVPNIEVLYNEACYSLFGTSDDDPESYFLSDVRELDRPLSQFFASLRAIISSEIGPTDELMIRFDPLDFEFGERSNEKFLSRSLREILDCHAALAAKDSSISPDPAIQLIVQRDSEEHFLELLADVECGDDQSNHSEDLEASEMHDGQMQHESSEGTPSDESSANDQDVFDTAHQEPTAVQPMEGKNESKFDAVPDHDYVTKEEEYNFQVDADGSRSPSIPQDSAGDENLEPDYLEAQSHFDELPEETADEDQDWAQQAEDDEPTASELAELLLETSDEPQTVHQAGNELGEIADPRTADGASTPADSQYDQEAASNGKHPPSISPVYHSPYRKQPTPVLHDDPVIDKFDDGEPIISMPRTGHESACTSQALCIHAMVPAPGPEEAEFWEIDYSDDESGPSPCSTLAGQCATHGRLSSVSSPLELKANSSMHGTSPAGYLCFGKVAERGNANITFSSTNDANMLAYQDDDLVLALDEAPDLETARDGEGDEYDEYTITYNATENTTDDTEGVDGAYESLIGYDASDSAANNNGAQVSAAAETASVQTSATFDGDEIGYEEHNTAEDLHAVESDSAQQPLTTLGGEDDEIDWENDGDEDGQQSASADESVEYEERKENTLPPSSLAGKRSRTDEAESLADETGMLASPPPKRLRTG